LESDGSSLTAHFSFLRNGNAVATFYGANNVQYSSCAQFQVPSKHHSYHAYPVDK